MPFDARVMVQQKCRNFKRVEMFNRAVATLGETIHADGSAKMKEKSHA
jgi:hypothetical protein